MPVTPSSDGANPAQLLHQRLSDWAVVPPNQSIVDHRGRNEENRPAITVWYERVSEAARWLDATEREAQRQESARPGPAFALEPVWTKCYLAILTPEEPATTAASQERRLVSDDVLRTLALVGAAWHQVYPADPQAYADVLDLVRRTRDLVSESAHLDGETKSYITQLTLHCESVLADVRNRGVGDVRQAATELVGALQIHFLDNKSGDSEEQQAVETITVRLKKRIETVFWAEFVPLMIGAGIDAGQRALEGPHQS